MRKAPAEAATNSAGFFDQFSRFYSSSKTGATSKRLHARYKVIIEANKEIIAGARVLDIASHDGRWSFAALKAGAAHVIGIEARPHLVFQARDIFRAYGADPSQYEFKLADVFNSLPRITSGVDVVLLLGFFYHTARHAELVDFIARTGARHVILDTNIISANENASRLPIVHLREDATALEGNAVGAGEKTLAGYPSREAITMIFSHFGYSSIREVDWRAHLGPDNKGLLDYARDGRATFLISRLDG